MLRFASYVQHDRPKAVNSVATVGLEVCGGFGHQGMVVGKHLVEKF